MIWAPLDYNTPEALFFYTLATKFNSGFHYLKYEKKELENCYKADQLKYDCPEVNLVFYGGSSLVNEADVVMQFLKHNPTVKKLNLFCVELSKEMSQQDVTDNNLAKIKAAHPGVNIEYSLLQKNFFDLNFDEDIRKSSSDIPIVVFALKNTIGMFDVDGATKLTEATYAGLHPGDKYIIGASLWGDDTFYINPANALFELLPETLAGIPPFLLVRNSSLSGKNKWLSYKLQMDYFGFKKDTSFVIGAGERYDTDGYMDLTPFSELVSLPFNRSNIFISTNRSREQEPRYSVLIATK
jgi:hypothetical protein